MSYLFTSESVGAGHPDKVCDIVSDALVDEFIARDPNSRCAIECMFGNGVINVMGEVTSTAYVDVQEVVRRTIKEIGYNSALMQCDGETIGVLVALDEQSPDIAMGVNSDDPLDTGAGDQGLMFGYATNETKNYMPVDIDIAHKIVEELAIVRSTTDLMPYLGPDCKSQVTVEIDETTQKVVGINTIVVSTQHTEFADDETMLAKIREDVKKIIIPRVAERYKDDEYMNNLFWNEDGHIKYLINPTGRFVIAASRGDIGLTGRKIVVDNYGGHSSLGGGCYSSKDATKVDRSAAYFARYVAKNCVSAGLADKMQIQVAYAIGVASPVSINVNTYGTSKCGLSDREIADKISTLFDFRPGAIIQALKLREPIFKETASYGHYGRTPITVEKTFGGKYEPKFTKTVELFTWEKLDQVDYIKSNF